MQSSKRSRRSWFVVVFLAVVLAAASCGGGGSDSGGDFKSITLRQTGGIAALDRSVSVQANGELSKGGQLADVDLDRLRQLVGQAEAVEVKPTYVPEGLCCDQFHYHLSIEVGGRTIATETADGAAGPKVVEDIIGVMVSQLPTS